MAQSPDSPASGRIVALDGLRGFAAFAVLTYHITRESWPSHGYLAVDLFFLLSGYVLAGAYEGRLRQGMTLLRFLRERLARLYPLYLAGLTLGLCGSMRTQGATALHAWLINLGFGAAARVTGGEGFWLDPPLWSLALEVGVGVIFAAGMWRFTNWMLAVVVVIAGGVLAFGSLRAGGVDLGWQTGLWQFSYGDARVMFSFPLGWLAWRLRDRLAPFVGPGVPWLALIGPGASWILQGGGLGDLVAVMVLYPLAVAALALGAQPAGALYRASALAGALSYPLYATHAVVIPLAWWLAPSDLAVVHYGGALAVSLAVAWLMHRTIEPLGRQLSSGNRLGGGSLIAAGKARATGG